jgi:glycosyltransferase involved in cell wall biosynthesis
MIDGMELPSISVVIPTHGRPELLRRCLRAVIEQAYPADRVDIVVVEDGGPAGAGQIVRDLQERHPEARLRYLAVEQGGPGAARNAGLRQASGHVIAFTDDDTIPDGCWLQEGAWAIQEGADAVSGRTVVPLSDEPTDAEANVQGLERATFPTCNVFVKRDWMERVGGFDPGFKRAYREDSDLEFRLLDAGARVARADQAMVVHPPRPERPFASLRQQRNQFYDALLYRKHPRRFRATIRRYPPMPYYAITLAQAGSVAAAVLGRPRVAVLATALWSTLAARFFVHRARGRSQMPEHLAELALTSVLIPPLAVYWRLRGAWAFRVPFL